MYLISPLGLQILKYLLSGASRKCLPTCDWIYIMYHEWSGMLEITVSPIFSRIQTFYSCENYGPRNLCNFVQVTYPTV